MLRIPLKSKWNGIQKQNVPPARRSADGEATSIIVIRTVPVFIRLLVPNLMRCRSRAANGGTRRRLLLAALIGADQGQMRVTSLDRWTLNLFLPLRRDAVAQRGIKGACACSQGDPVLCYFQGSLHGLMDCLRCVRTAEVKRAMLFFFTSCFKTHRHR